MEKFYIAISVSRYLTNPEEAKETLRWRVFVSKFDLILFYSLDNLHALPSSIAVGRGHGSSGSSGDKIGDDMRNQDGHASRVVVACPTLLQVAAKRVKQCKFLLSVTFFLLTTISR